MNVHIQSVRFDADHKLVEFVERKMAKLDRFADRATGADVIMKLDKDDEKGQQGGDRDAPYARYRPRSRGSGREF